MGRDDTPVTIVEFGDFECPVCHKFENGALRAARTKYAASMAVVFREFPLVAIHRFAYPSARAAECAAEQGRFEQFHDTLYAHTDSLGRLIPFSDIAMRAGVPNMTSFETCNTKSGPVPAIEADIQAAKDLGSRGTPTLLINGMLVGGAPSDAMLDSLIQVAIAHVKSSNR